MPKDLPSTYTKQECEEHIVQLIKNLKQLPPTEIQYYFALLVASIKNEAESEKQTHLIIAANETITALNNYYRLLNDPVQSEKPDLMPVTDALKNLVELSDIQSTPHRIKMALLGLCSLVLGFIIGTIGAVTGLIGGLFSDYTLIGNIENAGLGCLVGSAFGALAGSRAANMLFQDAFEKKLEFCMNGILKVAAEIPARKPKAEYEAIAKQFVLEEFFKDTPEGEKEAAFQAFLTSSVQFQICTKTAGFVSSKLKGHLGHHSLILYSINNKFVMPMEYGDRMKYDENNKFPTFLDQRESLRTISGQKLFEMITLDHLLQETNQYTIPNFLNNYDIGCEDCLTYINKLLIATDQAPTKMKRFNPENDKWTGKNITGPMISFFKKIEDEELKSIIPYFKENPHDPDPTITFHKWKKTNPVDKEFASNPSP